jgi:hypothetical protein
MMATKRRNDQSQGWRSNWWLLPAALLFTVTGLGQSMWMWEHTAPQGLAPLTLLLWVGVTAAGLTLPIYWLSRLWQPVAWLAAGVWAAAPLMYDTARHYQRATQTNDAWFHRVSPLLLLLLLGVGLSGAMMSVAGLLQRRWSSSVPAPHIRPWRESFFSGLYVVLCGWLLINRVFGFVPALLLAGALLLFETYFVARESSS